jgi:hypothetical protein
MTGSANHHSNEGRTYESMIPVHRYEDRTMSSKQGTASLANASDSPVLLPGV